MNIRPLVDREHSGSFVTIDHRTRPRISVPQHTQAILDAMVLGARRVGSVTVLMRPIPGTGQFAPLEHEPGCVCRHISFAFVIQRGQPIGDGFVAVAIGFWPGPMPVAQSMRRHHMALRILRYLLRHRAEYPLAGENLRRSNLRSSWKMGWFPMVR